MKESITKKILEKVADASVDAIDLFIAYLNAGYGASYGKIMKELEKVKSGEMREVERSEDFKKIKTRFNRMISCLKKDGLIEKKGRGDNSVLFNTKLGIKKLRTIKEKDRNIFPEIGYQKPEGKEVVLITFDVPENERSKRNWLRSALNEMGFELLHRSVYLGRGKLPRDFIRDLGEVGLVDFVEVIEINKSGTLKRLLK